MNDGTRSALVVEDDFLIALGLTSTLEEMGLVVFGPAATAAEAIELARKHRPSVVLMDVRLKGQPDGVIAAQEIHRMLGTPIIFVTGSREPETVERINHDHPTAILFKPVLPAELKAEVQRVLN